VSSYGNKKRGGGGYDIGVFDLYSCICCTLVISDAIITQRLSVAIVLSFDTKYRIPSSLSMSIHYYLAVSETVTGGNPPPFVETSLGHCILQKISGCNPHGSVRVRSPLVGRTGSGVRVKASFQIFALRMQLHSAGEFPAGYFSLGEVISCGNISRGDYLIVGHCGPGIALGGLFLSSFLSFARKQFKLLSS